MDGLKKLVLRRLVALSLAVAMLFTGAPVYAAQASNLQANSSVAHWRPAETSTAAQDPPAALDTLAEPAVPPQPTPVDLLAGRTVKVQVDEDEDGMTVLPDYGDAGTYYDENAAAAANENMEYLGSVEGTDLATYEIKRDENAAASEFDSVMDDEKISELKAYYEASYPRGDALEALVAQADDYSDSIAERMKDSGYLATLQQDKENPAFRVIQIDQNDGSATAVSGGAAAASARDYMDSNYVPMLAGAPDDTGGAIYVVDDDSIIVIVEDLNGRRINGAAVTIKASNGKLFKGTTSRQNGVDGTVAFTGMLGVTSGFLNIEAPNYRIVTELDIDIRGGTPPYLRKLTPTNPEDVYVRCISMGGAEAMNKPAKLWLTTMDNTKPFDFTVLLASGGGVGKLSGKSLTLVATNNGSSRNLPTISGRDYDGFTKAYVFSEKWAAKNGGLLRDGDVLSIRDNAGKTYNDQKINVTIRNSPVGKPQYSDAGLGLLNKGLGLFSLPKDIPFLSDQAVSMDFLEFDFTVIMGLNGKGVFSYNADIKKIIEHKAFWEEPWEPRKQEKTEKVGKEAQSEFDKKMDLYTSARAFLKPENGKPTKFLDASKSVNVNAIFCGQIEYDWDTSYINVDLNAMVTVAGKFGMTYYVVIPAPVPPIYVGFEASASAGVGGFIGIRFKPQDIMGTFGINPDGKNGINVALNLGLALYVGAGIRGLMCVEADGHFSFTGNIDFRANEQKPPNKSYPRFTVDFDYGATLRVVALVFSISHSWDAKSINLVDTWGLNKTEDLEIKESTEIYEITFSGEGGAEGVATEYNSATGAMGSATLAAVPASMEQEYANGVDGKDGPITRINSGASAELPFKVITVNKTNYLFRIAYMKYGSMPWNEAYPTVVYQKQLPNGTYEDKLYMVPPSSRDKWYCNDYEFDVITEPYPSSTEVHVLITSGRLREGKPEVRAKQTETRMVIIDMATNKVLDQQTLSKPNTGTYHYNPKLGYIGFPVHNYKYFWLESPELSDVGKTNNTVAWWAEDHGEDKKGKTFHSEKQLQPVQDFFSISEWFRFRTSNGAFADKQFTIVETPTGSRLSSAESPEHYRDFGGKISNLQAVQRDPLLSDSYDRSECSAILYNIDGRLELLYYDAAASTPIKTPDGKPFSLPENCYTYKYIPLGKDVKNGEAVSKIVAITKNIELIAGKEYVSSVVHVYNLLRNSKNEIIIHGPISYTLRGQDINRADVRSADGYAEVLFTSNTTARVEKESVTLAGGKIEPGRKAEACEMYTWSEKDVYSSVIVTEFSIRNPFVNKKDAAIEAQVTVTNDTQKHIKNASFKIVDYNNNELINCVNKIGELYPGESRTVTVKFPPLKSWKPGAMELTAFITGATANGTDELDMSEDTGKTLVCDDFAIGLEAQQVILDSGYYAAVSFYNESLVPTTADTTHLKAYVLTSNSLLQGGRDVFDAKVGQLLEGDDNSGTFKAYKYSTLIPLNEYWEDESCSGVLLELSAMDGDDLVTKTVKLDNPNAAHRFAVSGVANDATYGAVEGGGYLLPGDTTTLEAKPYHGYRFVRWVDEDGNAVSRAASYPVTMTNNDETHLVAEFEETGDVHRVTVLSTQHLVGTTSLSGEPNREDDGLVMARNNAEPAGSPSILCYRVAHGGDITVMAIPGPGYRFRHWEDEDGKVLSASAEYTFSVNREIAVKAVFASEQSYHTVYFDAATNGGSCAVDSMQTDETGRLASLPTATKSGASFRGWYTAATGGTRVAVSTVFTQDTLLYAQFSTGSSSSGDSVSPETFGGAFDSTPPFVAAITPEDAATQARQALADGQTYLRLRNVQTLSPAAMKAVADAAKAAGKTLTIYADTIRDGKVVLRLYIDPVKGAALTEDIKLNGAIGNASILKLFQKHFVNKLAVISLDQQKSFQMPVGVAAKVDLTGFDTKNLYFYAYDAATNRYNPITTDYWLDANGYLHFTTTLAGSIIISDGPLKGE